MTPDRTRPASPRSDAAAAPSPRPVLVLDFDGTVCVGEAPVLGYAEQVAGRLPPSAGERVRTGIREFLAGSRALPDCEDGYPAVVALSGQDLSQEDLSAAYLASRAELDVDATHPPNGLTQLLDELRAAGVAAVLVTNAPLVGVDVWLARHELAERLDAVVPDAGKPTRMRAVLSGILTEFGAAPAHLASVGDVWRNDIEPAMALGAVGMYLDRFGTGLGPASRTETTFEAMYPHIRRWARDAGAVADDRTGTDTQSSPN
ncbi:HAD family hydrolase [Sanguibacter sp. Z1732]|uniref:HAD family hydrolase n=1 Tax=Sanguibacter sp. Z1732 TaxID=3435412 RepID=UPI003D9C8905